MYCNWKVQVDVLYLGVASWCTVTGRCKLVYCISKVEGDVL